MGRYRNRRGSWIGLRSFQSLPHHTFDLRPDAAIALTLHVACGKNAAEPGCLRALDWILLVILPVISQYLGLSRISGSDLGPAMKDAVRLIEIHGCGDVVGNDGVVLPRLGDAIHLHRQ